MRWMGVLFSIFLIIAFGLVFNAVQAPSPRPPPSPSIAAAASASAWWC